MSLKAISPIDGRYADRTAPLVPYFSEHALIRFRLKVEVEYFIALCRTDIPALRNVPEGAADRLRAVVDDFSDEDARRVKEIERTTNHDVKAVEYFLKEKLAELGLERFGEFVHFGLTSQDINNTAVPMTIKCCLADVYNPALNALVHDLADLATAWRDIPMLARTHGQPASPTRLGKEIAVFVERLKIQLESLRAVPMTGKFGGATGNFNAHHAAFPDIDWPDFADRFLKDSLNISRQQTTTQIEHYDQLAAKFDAMRRIHTVLIDLCRDLWTYISMDYFKQAIKPGEVGSSAMPHKVNPIDFENAEGNLGMANAVLGHLSEKLPISRLQRDLTDSTVVRNIGLPFGYALIAVSSISRGLKKLVVNETAIKADLDKNWVVLAEAFQTILRREGHAKPYEALRDLTRTHETIDQDALYRFIDTLDVAPHVKEEMRNLSPFNYVGVQAKGV